VFEHCDFEDLDTVFGVSPSPEDVKQTVSLLIRGRGQRQGSPPPDAAYDALLNRAKEYARRAQCLPDRERVRFYKTLSLLASGKGVESLVGVRQGRAGLGLYEALLARSWAVRFDDPQEMCRLADAAVEVAARFSPKTHGVRRVADLRARAWGELANACRVADRLREAKKAFGQAFAFLQRGTGDPLLKARLLDLEASFFGALREFASAHDRLDLVPELYRKAGEPHMAGRTFIKKAVYLAYSGNPEEALRLLREGLGLIDQEREPDLVVTALHNQLSLLIDLGRFQKAQRLLFENRERFRSCGRISGLKLRGLEGQISYGLERWTGAEIAFREVKEGFRQAGLGFAHALESLYLAMTLLRQGRVDEAEREVFAASKVFFSLQIHREILGSVLLLKETAELRRLTVAILENEVRHIRQAEMEHGHAAPGDHSPVCR
jgi:tetratricopeptide (TPR) repeat protein